LSLLVEELGSVGSTSSEGYHDVLSLLNCHRLFSRGSDYRF
jgi:hypothetical protein